MAHDVFISYSSKDKPVADAICARLEGQGIRCWIAPRDIVAGTDWSASIIEAIGRSKIFVLIYSASANESPQIRREVERAVNKRLAILPFRIEDAPMSESLEYFISTPHWLDALTPPLTQHLDTLANAVAVLLQKAPPAPRPSPQPAPPPSPRPVPPAPSARPMGLWIGIGAVILALVLAGVYLLRPHGSATLDGRFVGSWQTKGQVAGITCEGTSAVQSNGSYGNEIHCQDSGSFSADGRGRYRSVAANQTVIDGTYRFLSPDSMALSNALGTATWTRKTPAVPGSPFAGTWETTALLPNGTWQIRFEISAAGSYTLTSSRKDTGTLTATQGQWRTASSMQPADGGTYNFVNDDSLEMAGMLGKGLWTRK